MTITPGRWDFTIYQGSRFYEALAISGLDLTGLEARMQLREAPADLSGLYALNLDSATGNGITVTVTDSSTATIEIEIGATVTQTLNKAYYLYDLEIYDPTDEDATYRLLYGKATISKEVTR